MNKGLITRLGETIDQHRQEHQAQVSQPAELTNRSRLPGIVRWFLPNGGTLLLVAILILTQNVWAGPVLRNLAAENAASTNTIAYQGRLADKDGNSLTARFRMTFRLYNVSSGGIAIWTEEWTSTNEVIVSDGLFNVMLGSLTPIPQSVITGNNSLFLGITVGNDDEMSPRVQLGSVPFAVQALTVPDGSITTAKIADGAITSSKIESVVFDSLSVKQSNVVANVQSVQGDTERSIGASGYSDLLEVTVVAPEPATLRITFHSLVWKTDGNGRTALGVRIDGSPNTVPDPTSFVQVATPISTFWTSFLLVSTHFVDVPAGSHKVVLVLGSWDAGTSYARAYKMNVESLRKP